MKVQIHNPVLADYLSWDRRAGLPRQVWIFLYTVHYKKTLLSRGFLRVNSLYNRGHVLWFDIGEIGPKGLTCWFLHTTSQPGMNLPTAKGQIISTIIISYLARIKFTFHTIYNVKSGMNMEMCGPQPIQAVTNFLTSMTGNLSDGAWERRNVHNNCTVLWPG